MSADVRCDAEERQAHVHAFVNGGAARQEYEIVRSGVGEVGVIAENTVWLERGCISREIGVGCAVAPHRNHAGRVPQVVVHRQVVRNI